MDFIYCSFQLCHASCSITITRCRRWAVKVDPWSRRFRWKGCQGVFGPVYGLSASTPSSLSLFQFANSSSSESLLRFCPLPLNKIFLLDLLSTMCHTPKTPYASFSTLMCTNVISFSSTSEPSQSLGEEIRKIKSIPYDPLVRDSSKGSLLMHSLLSVTDNFSYTRQEFEFRKVHNAKVIDCILEGEACSFEIFSYERAYTYVFMETRCVPPCQLLKILPP